MKHLHVPGRCAMVTGANKGIGLETVRQLASREVTVVLTARDEGRGAAAAELWADERGVPPARRAGPEECRRAGGLHRRPVVICGLYLN
ncbi:hypothetical protein NL676_008919 [Syzygium grande]|nr:hypothetical protein NL676_008919 [Syzygium grande]